MYPSLTASFLALALPQMAFATFKDFGNDLLEFDPPTLNLNDGLFRNKFRCRLKHKPEKPVNVYFEGAGISFEGCSLNFDLNNHDQFQEIHHAGVSVFDKRDESEALIRARVFHGEDRFEHEYKGRRNFFQGGICHALGDGHFKTFDDLLINHNQHGQFHLFDHEQFSIQAIRAPCFRPGGACHHAVSVRYGDSIMALDVRDESFESEVLEKRTFGAFGNKKKNNRRLQKGGKKGGFLGKVFGREKKRQTNRNYEMRQITPNRHGIIYTRPSLKNAFHHLRFPCGSEIKFHVVQDKFDAWINTVIHLSSGYDKFGGLCNRVRERGQLCHRDGSRSAREDFGRFVRSWTVKEEESIFHRKFKPSIPKAIIHGRVCRVPERHVEEDRRPYNPPALPTYTPLPFSIIEAPQTTTQALIETTTIAAPVTTTTTVTEATTTALAKEATTTAVPTATANVVEVLPTPPANQEFENQVQKHCTELFDVSGCKETSNVEVFIQICINTCKSSGNFAQSESIRLSFMAQCHTTTNYMIHDSKPQMVQQAAQTQQNVGFNALTCPNNCSGHGECGVNGCRCAGGFSGLDCSIDEKSLPAFNPETKQYQPVSPPEIFPQEPALPPTPPPTAVKYQPQLEVPFDVSTSNATATNQAPVVFVTPIPTSSLNTTGFDTVYSASLTISVSAITAIGAFFAALA